MAHGLPRGQVVPQVGTSCVQLNTHSSSGLSTGFAFPLALPFHWLCQAWQLSFICCKTSVVAQTTQPSGLGPASTALSNAVPAALFALDAVTVTVLLAFAGTEAKWTQ
eukprot:351312-Chlamydomonas_euryale.AAC.1